MEVAEVEKPSGQSNCPGSERSPSRTTVSTTIEEQINRRMEDASHNIVRVATPELSTAQMEENGDHISPVDDTIDIVEAEKQTDQSVRPRLEITSAEPVDETAQDKPRDHRLVVNQSSDTAGAEIGQESEAVGSRATEEQPKQSAAIHVSTEPMAIPVNRVMTGIVSTEAPTLINASTADKGELVVSAATSTTCSEQHIDETYSVEANVPPQVINIQTELEKVSSTAVSLTVDESHHETATVGIESVCLAPHQSIPTVEPSSVCGVEHIPQTISSGEPTNDSRIEPNADSSKELVNSNNGENTRPDSGCIIGTMTQIKREKFQDYEIAHQHEQFDETAAEDYSERNEVELSEYQWSNEQSFQVEGNVNQHYESDGDPDVQRSWQGQAMLEVIDYNPGDPRYSAGAEGQIPNLNFCIDSVRGDVPWPLSGGEDEGNDAAGTNEQAVDSHRIRFKKRGRGRGGIDLLALPYLRQKNRAGTADGYYSLNSNVKGLIAWLSHSKGPYTLTVTTFGFKVVEEPPDAAETSFTCELCKANYTDVESFLGHCRETRHIASKVAAVQRSLNLYHRQIAARTLAKRAQDGGGVVNTVSTEDASNIGLAPNLYKQKVRRGGYRGRRRGRGRSSKQSYEHRLQFTQRRKLQNPPNPLLPKRGRGRPRKYPLNSSSVGMTEGNQPLPSTSPFEKTKPSGEEDRRILRVKPLPRQEDDPECAMDEVACDSDGPPPLTVPSSAVHDTSLSDISSPKRALFNHSETSPGHSAEPRRKRQRYSTETPQESDASSTSTSVRSRRRSSREVMDSPRYEDHTPPKTNPGEVIKRGRGRPRKIRHPGINPEPTPASRPVAQAATPLGTSSGISLAQTLPVPILKLERTSPEKLLAAGRERVQPGPSSTITSSSSFGNEELLNSLTDDQLWAELLERKTVYSCTCGFAFSTSSAYYLHKACHNTVNEKTCSFCGLEAANWMMFHAHFFNHKAPT